MLIRSTMEDLLSLFASYEVPPPGRTLPLIPILSHTADSARKMLALETKLQKVQSRTSYRSKAMLFTLESLVDAQPVTARTRRG
jgi:hypothetical protein